MSATLHDIVAIGSQIEKVVVFRQTDKAAAVHKSSYKKFKSGEKTEITIRSGGMTGAGVKARLQDLSVVVANFGIQDKSGKYVWIEYIDGGGAKKEGFINRAHLVRLNDLGSHEDQLEELDSGKSFANHQRTEVLKETAGFLNGIGGYGGMFPEPEAEALVVTAEQAEDVVRSPTAPSELSPEQRDWLSGLSTGLTPQELYNRGFIARFDSSDAIAGNNEHFHALAAAGKLLWTLDTDFVLSIGTPAGNKHAVVAGGMDVWAAGEFHLKSAVEHALATGALTQAELTLWGDIVNKQREVPQLRNMGEEDLAQEGEANIAQWLEQLGGQGRFDEIMDLQTQMMLSDTGRHIAVLDFGSGHYAPRGAWSKATRAWTAAGFVVEWDSDSTWV